MDPELCPPWWPSLIWWLLRHHPHLPEPPPEEWIKRVEGPIEEILVGLSTFVQAEAFVGRKQEKLRNQMQESALEQMNSAMGQLRR